MNSVDLDPPTCREFSVRGLGFGVTLFWELKFCVHLLGSNPVLFPRELWQFVGNQHIPAHSVGVLTTKKDVTRIIIKYIQECLL